MASRPSHIDPEWLELKFLVPKEHAGWRVDIFISNRIPRLSRTRVQSIIKRSAFDHEGKSLKPNFRVSEGDIISIYRPPPEEPDVPRDFEIVYEDEWMMAIDKPPGLPVHPTARYHKNTLTGVLKERYGAEHAPKLAHRIDSETSGVLLLAKTKDAEKALKIMFAERKMSKLYIAVVFGVPDPPSGRIEVPLGPDPGSLVNVKMAHNEQGQPALTEYRTIRSSTDRALLECRPRTGRQHQIRAHLTHIGYPIVGDKIYGPDPHVFLDYLEQGLTDEILHRAGHKRHALHAASLSFVHPMTNEQLEITAPIPEEFYELLI